MGNRLTDQELVYRLADKGLGNRLAGYRYLLCNLILKYFFQFPLISYFLQFPKFSNFLLFRFPTF